LAKPIAHVGAVVRAANPRRIVKAIVPPRYHVPLQTWAARATHAGTRRYCPCCDSHLRRFGPYGERPRPDAMCPVCGALERHRLATLFLNRRRDALGERVGRVLHIAPEPPVARVLQGWAAVSYVSVDLYAENVTVQADLTRMPFRSRAFDAIYCSHVLEHVADDRRAMEELHRVLRPGGWALIQVPIKRDVTFEDPTITDPESRRRLFGQPDHVRVYGRDFGNRLARARFAVSVERPQCGLDAAAIERYGLKTREDLFLCTRDA
jgi:SAM-dependent methyltransferase